jgi:hypothetical protein
MEIKDIIHPYYSFPGYSLSISIPHKPQYRFLNSLEQCTEKYDPEYYYLVLRSKGSSNVGIKFKKCIILEELIREEYFKSEGLYKIEFYYKQF